MAEKTSIYIHVGLPKTGSSFLQDEIFPNLENVNYLGKYLHEGANPFYCKLDNKKINLISDESLTDYCGIKRGNMDKSANRFEKAKRLKSVFPDASIILILREKKSWIKSCHRQHCKFAPFVTLEEFKDSIEEWQIDFDSYVDLLNSLFENVLVLNYELLKEDSSLFVEKICNFICVNPPQFENKVVNKSPSLELLKKRYDKKMKINNFLKIFSSNEHKYIENLFSQIINKLN